MLQSFLQRVQNYLCSLQDRWMMREFTATSMAFVKKSGYLVCNVKEKTSSAVATIVAADWTIEFPQPIPPTIHVSTAPIF